MCRFMNYFCLLRFIAVRQRMSDRCYGNGTWIYVVQHNVSDGLLWRQWWNKYRISWSPEQLFMYQCLCCMDLVTFCFLFLLLSSILLLVLLLLLLVLLLPLLLLLFCFCHHCCCCDLPNKLTSPGQISSFFVLSTSKFRQFTSKLWTTYYEWN